VVLSLVLLAAAAAAAALARWIAALRRRAAASARREVLLSRVGDLLGDADGDPDETLRDVAGIAVPDFADWCAIDLLDEDGGIRRAGVAHADAARRALAEELERRWPPRLDDGEGAGLTIRTGASQRFADIPPASSWPAGTRDPEHLRLLTELGMRSGMVVPLTARGRTLGAMTLMADGSGRRYGPDDLALAEELGRRCALAIDNLRLLAEARRARRQLEESYALLETLFSSAPVGLAFLDRAGRFVRVNDQLADINGIPAEDHIGRTADELVPDLDSTAGAVRTVVETGRAIIEDEVVGETPAAPGTRREWLASYYPVWRGELLIGVGAVVFEVTERRAAQRALRAQTDRYETLLLALSEVGEGMVVLEGNHLVDANPAFEELSGYPLDELRALRSVWDLVPDWHRAEARRRAELRARKGMLDPHYELVIVHRSGRLVDVDVAAVPLRVDEREQLVVVVRDITARKRAEAELEHALALERQARETAEAAESRMALLARASAVFDQSLDEQETLERIARLTVDEVADTCTIMLAHPGAPARRAIAVARDPAREARLGRLAPRWPADLWPERAVAAAARSGRATLLRHVGRRLDALAEDDAHARELREVGLSAVALVPLGSGGRTFGAMACGFADPPSPDHERETLSLLEDLGGRAALAIENARLYAERTHVARTLQRSLLPAKLPAIPGMELAARYRPAGEGNEVGGDFYDLFPAGGGEYAMVIGDVCGKGAEAAAVTALARHTVRASVLHGEDPAGVLAELNRAILAHGLDHRFCTVLHVALRRAGDGWDASIASGGHPLPLVLRADGSVVQAGRTGTLLGIVPDPDLAVERVRLGPGDALVAFTDGVTEASPLDDALGPRALAGFLGGQAGRPAAGIAAAIEAEVLALQDGRLRDDVALVVLRVASGA
jgi:PAS domain S-box-containing protein